MRPPTRLLLALLAVPSCPATRQGAVGTPSIEVAGTSFRVTLPDGRILASPDLIGAVLDVADEAGRSMTVRIDAVAPDSSDRDGDCTICRCATSRPGAGATSAPPPAQTELSQASHWREAGAPTAATCAAPPALPSPAPPAPSAGACALATNPGATPAGRRSGITIRPVVGAQLLLGKIWKNLDRSHSSPASGSRTVRALETY
jgi:hypothetical protein